MFHVGVAYPCINSNSGKVHIKPKQPKANTSKHDWTVPLKTCVITLIDLLRPILTPLNDIYSIFWFQGYGSFQTLFRESVQCLKCYGYEIEHEKLAVCWNFEPPRNCFAGDIDKNIWNLTDHFFLKFPFFELRSPFVRFWAFPSIFPDAVWTAQNHSIRLIFNPKQIFIKVFGNPKILHFLGIKFESDQ